MKLKQLIIPVLAALFCLFGLFLCIAGPDILLNIQEQSVLDRVSTDDGYYQNEVDAYTGELDMYRKLLMINGVWDCDIEVISGEYNDTLESLDKVLAGLQESIFSMPDRMGIVPNNILENDWYPETILLYQYTDSVFGKYQFDVLEVSIIVPDFETTITIMLDMETSLIFSLDAACGDEDIYNGFRKDIEHGSSPFTTYLESHSDILSGYIWYTPIIVNLIEAEFASSYFKSINNYNDFNLSGVQKDNDKIVNYYFSFVDDKAEEPVYLIIEYRPDGARLFFTVQK